MGYSREYLKTLEVVNPDELGFLVKADNVENISFPPIGHVITLQKEFVMAPPIFGKEKSKAIAGNDKNGNIYYITPKHITGEIFIAGGLKRINKIFDGSLDNFLKTMPKVKLVEFKQVEVDIYGKDGTKFKSFPIYELVK